MKFKRLKFSLVLILIVALLGACSSGGSTGSSQGPDSTGGSESASSNSGGSEEKKDELRYPVKPLNAIVPYAPGGGTDLMARKIAMLAESTVGQSIVILNKAGASGSIGTKEALSADDGYTLLMAAENANLYRTTGIADFSFHDFEPILLMGRAVPVIVTKSDSRWNTIQELLAEAEQNPGKIKVMNTGPVGISGVVTAMLGRDFNKVPYDGAGPGLAGLLGGHVDAAIVDIPAAKGYITSGDFKVLAVVNDTRLDSYPDWPALGEEMPEYNKYLPWGPYYGVYVKKGTPEEIVEYLREAFKAAYETEEFQQYLEQNNLVPLGLSGEEAVAFQVDWESKTNWLLYEAGVAEDPSKYDIPKPE